MIVAFAIGSGIKPMPDAPSTIEIADSMPIMAICRVSNFFLLIAFSK